MKPPGKKSAAEWIQYLGLIKHPEGGWFKETYRSTENIKQENLPTRFSDDRSFSTSIYFLLQSNEYSAFHRIKQDEIWYFHEGSSLTIYVINENAECFELNLGKNLENREQLQIIVEAGWLFAAKVNDQNSFTLAGCNVAPGFDFDDFEMPERKQLLDLYPQHKSIIMQFSKE